MLQIYLKYLVTAPSKVAAFFNIYSEIPRVTAPKKVAAPLKVAATRNRVCLNLN